MILRNLALICFTTALFVHSQEEEENSDNPLESLPGFTAEGSQANATATDDDQDGPFETLIKKCDSWKFPDESFQAQEDANKVYLRIDQTADGPFKQQKLVKFATVFGIRIVGDEGVDDEKILHVANNLASIIDFDGDGQPDNKQLIEELRTYHPILFIMADSERIMTLMSAQNADEGFPLELKFCPFAFDFEESKKINPGAPAGDATCGDDDEANPKDRTLAFVLDHLMGRGFVQVMGPEREKKLQEIYKESLDAKTFEPENTGCPPESDECGRVMFASWGLSTLLGFDKCWCEQAKALKFCDADALKQNEPELANLLTGLFPDVKADAQYAPKSSESLVK